MGADLDRQVGAALGLILSLPLLAATALAVLVGLGRPVFLRQWRVGRDNVPFRILKFRTMREGEGSDAERLTPSAASCERPASTSCPSSGTSFAET